MRGPNTKWLAIPTALPSSLDEAVIAPDHSGIGSSSSVLCTMDTSQAKSLSMVLWTLAVVL